MHNLSNFETIKGTPQGLQFNFQSPSLNGILYYGFIPQNDSKFPQPIFVGKAAKIKAGVATAFISTMGDNLDMIGWDGDDDRELPFGEVGELCVRGPYTLRGYFGAPEHNARVFTADGFYCSGDLMRQHPSGNYMVEGRIKDVINRGGVKFNPADVEALIDELSKHSWAPIRTAPRLEGFHDLGSESFILECAYARLPNPPGVISAS